MPLNLLALRIVFPTSRLYSHQFDERFTFKRGLIDTNKALRLNSDQ